MANPSVPAPSRRGWEVIAVFYAAEAVNRVICELAEHGLTSRVTVMGSRDALSGLLGSAFLANGVGGAKMRIGEAASGTKGSTSLIFQRCPLPFDGAGSGGSILISEGPLSRRMPAPSGDAVVSFADAIGSFVPASYATNLLQRMGEGAAVIWIDASNDDDRQCASRILLRHSLLPVQIHDRRSADGGSGCL